MDFFVFHEGETYLKILFSDIPPHELFIRLVGSLSFLVIGLLIIKLINIKELAEKTLHESEERYRSFVQNFQGIAYRCDLNFRPIFIHGNVEQITGFSEEEFISGKIAWDKIIHSRDFLIVYKKEKQTLRSTPNYSNKHEYQILRKDGQIRWIYEIMQNICDQSGKPLAFQGTIYDITNRKMM